MLLRQDDADMRLTEKSYNIGLASKERYDFLCDKKTEIERIIEFSEKTNIKPEYINTRLEQLNTSPIKQSTKVVSLLTRPQITIENIKDFIPELNQKIESIPNRKEEITEACEIIIKYSGYIEREKMIAEKTSRLENIKITGKFDYNAISSLSTEARQKLSKIQPETIAQANRIPGVSPNDINVLLVLMGR